MFVSVPETMMTSACRGEARNTTPYRSMSYRGAAMCIISTAQQARPNVSGHSEPCATVTQAQVSGELVVLVGGRMETAAVLRACRYHDEPRLKIAV